MINVLVADDHALIRSGLAGMLGAQPDLTIVGEAADGATAIALAAALHPDVVLMDVKMSGVDGITAAAALRTVAPESAVVMLSLHGDPVTRARAEAAGAVAFLEKQTAGPLLLTVIREAAAKKRRA